jgi:hypothetical protein
MAADPAEQLVDDTIQEEDEEEGASSEQVRLIKNVNGRMSLCRLLIFELVPRYYRHTVRYCKIRE